MDPIGLLRNYSDPVLQLSMELGVTSVGDDVAFNHVYGYANQNPIFMFDMDGLDPMGGERGASGGSSGKGTNNPYKHCRQHPTDPNKIICKHHQTGKDVTKPKPADWPSDKPNSNMSCPDGSVCHQAIKAVTNAAGAVLFFVTYMVCTAS